MGLANNAIVLMHVHENQQDTNLTAWFITLFTTTSFMYLVLDVHTQQSSKKGWTHKSTTWIKTIITLPGIRQ